MERSERDKVETLKGDTHDMVDEVKERVKAGAEKAKRAVAGDSMPLGERVGSHVKEMGHNLRADVDSAKRDVRDSAERTEDRGHSTDCRRQWACHDYCAASHVPPRRASRSYTGL